MITALQLDEIVKTALHEDLAEGDLTTDNLPELEKPGVAQIIPRQSCIISGLAVARRVFETVDHDLRVEMHGKDGQSFEPGQPVLTVRGSVASILKAERTALNFLQHLSGIATHTRRFVEAVAGTDCHITDTRKTTPGLRSLEKQAVVDGGGSPHRYNLGSSVMIKDNHIQAAGSIANAVNEIRHRISHTVKIEVEADSLQQVHEALEARADIILLDNMNPAMVREALAIIGNRAIPEASGGITIHNVREYAETGVGYISTSRITLGAPVVDLGLDIR